MIFGERFLVRAVFREVVAGDKDGEVVRDRPEAVIEQPMGVLAESEAVPDVVVPGVGELVDVGGVDDAAR